MRACWVLQGGPTSSLQCFAGDLRRVCFALDITKCHGSPGVHDILYYWKIPGLRFILVMFGPKSMTMLTLADFSKESGFPPCPGWHRWFIWHCWRPISICGTRQSKEAWCCSSEHSFPYLKDDPQTSPSTMSSSSNYLWLLFACLSQSVSALRVSSIVHESHVGTLNDGCTHGLLFARRCTMSLWRELIACMREWMLHITYYDG